VFTEKISFNNDYSGTSATEFDFSLFFPYMIDSTVTKAEVNLAIDSMVLELQNSLSEIDGVSDLKCNFDTNGIVHVDYNFANPQNLNEASNTMYEFIGLKEEDGPEVRTFIVHGKKKLEMQFNAELPDTTAESFGGLLTYNLNLEFSREVKKMEDKNEFGALKSDSLNLSDNKISYSGNPAPLLKAPKQSVVIKFGKKK
jgi:hypothetical protein